MFHLRNIIREIRSLPFGGPHFTRDLPSDLQSRLLRLRIDVTEIAQNPEFFHGESVIHLYDSLRSAENRIVEHNVRRTALIDRLHREMTQNHSVQDINRAYLITTHGGYNRYSTAVAE